MKNVVNLKKLVQVKGLPRFAHLEFGDGRIQLRAGKSEKSAEVIWEKPLPRVKMKKTAFKCPHIPGFMIRVMSNKIYIRPEIVVGNGVVEPDDARLIA